LGGILTAQHQYGEAAQHFEQLLKMLRKCGMRLEEARTKHFYGEMLVQGGEGNEKDYQRGMEYLQDARQVFVECKAELDVKLVEGALERCGTEVRM
jgi:hypothetical protein